MRDLHYIGVNSGTSVDAIDVAIVDISSHPLQESSQVCHDAQDFRYEIKLLHFESFPWSDEDRQLIFKIINSESTRDVSVRDVCIAHALVGRRMGECVRTTIEKFRGISGGNGDEEYIIGMHGQTVWHEPKPMSGDVSADQWTPSTLQIGEASIVAEMTGCRVISDFRQQDLHAGGNGAPLTSILDACLLRPISNTNGEEDDGQKIVIDIRALQNLGGIGNVTLVSSYHTRHITRTISFDTGPANAIIDDCVRIITNGQKAFDVDGNIASRGVVHEPFFFFFFFRMVPPKTTGRELFNATLAKRWIKHAQSKYGLSDESIVSTITELTARSIVLSYEQVLGEYSHLLLQAQDESKLKKYEFRLVDCICSGGGANNMELMRRLTNHLRSSFGEHVDVSSRVVAGIPSQSKEAVLFAFLAFQHVHNRVANIESCTGARGKRILGKTTPKQTYD